VTLTMADVPSEGSGRSRGSGPEGAGSRGGQPTRRTFTAAYKLRIVGEYDALTEHGSRGALLRSEGLYQSHIDKWRRARDRGGLGATGRPAEVKVVSESVESRRLKAENARLVAELAKTRAVLEVMGKVSALLDVISESADSEPKPTR
jgi:transposase